MLGIAGLALMIPEYDHVPQAVGEIGGAGSPARVPFAIMRTLFVAWFGWGLWLVCSCGNELAGADHVRVTSVTNLARVADASLQLPDPDGCMDQALRPGQGASGRGRRGFGVSAGWDAAISGLWFFGRTTGTRLAL